jgi:acyl dehydratase
MEAQAQGLDAVGMVAGARFESDQWVTISQELIDGFGRYTLDHDPFHVDPEWCKAHSPYGGTIAFGFLTMSLLTHLLHISQGDRARDTSADPSKYGYYLNYGFNKLRLVTPVPVGSRIRGRFKVKDVVIDEKGRQVVCFNVTVEIENEQRPALVAEWLAVWVPAEAIS